MQNLLVIGASGPQGQAQVNALDRAGYRVRALSRRPSRVNYPNKVSLVAGDLSNAEDVTAAVDGIDTIFLNLPSASFNPASGIVEQCRQVIAAAQNAGVERIIFNASLYVGDELAGHIAHDNRYELIELLFASDVPATAICPVIFMENILQGWTLPGLLQTGCLSYPHHPSLPVSWITLDDVARIMIQVCQDDRAIGRKWIVGGPQALRGDETAALLSRAWDRDIQFDSRAITDFAKEMGHIFSPDNSAEQQRIERDLADVYRWYNERSPSPFTVDMGSFLSEYPMTLTSLEAWARNHNPFRVRH